MKKVLLTLTGLTVGLMSVAQLSAPPNGGNQKSVVRQYLGALPFVEIVYNSPDVTGPNGQSRKGQIWGGLVPWGFQNLGFGLSTADNPSPWRAGANENTTIEFSHDVLVEGSPLKAGKYGFHVVPMESGPWTLIFSRDNNHWGSFYYRPANDALRLQVASTENQFTEWLTYEFTDRQVVSTNVTMMWEEKAVSFKVEMPNSSEIHLAKIQSEMYNNLGFNYLNVQAAAAYAQSVGALDKALEWADAAISAPFFGQRDFGTLQTKAGVLTAMGKVDEALNLMDEAIKMDGATVFAIHGYGRQLIAAGKKKEALEIFKYNQKRFDSVWPTNYGLARGYSAIGDYKNALKYLQLAKGNVPAGDTQNPPIIEANIEKLKKGVDIN